MVKERVEEDADLEFNESTTSFEHNSENYENELGKEIDNEWYTFVTNEKPYERETKILEESKEIDGIKTRESKVLITSKDPDSISNDSLFQCTTCLKIFSSARYLKRHDRFHIGKKPFECQACKKRFIQKCNLKKHERIHTGEKPYECKACHKRFNQQVALKIHERMHTGEEPYRHRQENAKFLFKFTV